MIVMIKNSLRGVSLEANADRSYVPLVLFVLFYACFRAISDLDKRDDSHFSVSDLKTISIHLRCNICWRTPFVICDDKSMLFTV